jgi:pyruvate,water dikinase
MGGFWRRLFGRSERGGRGPPRVPVSERFSHFQAISAANDEFLKRLTDLMEEAASPRPSAPDAVRVATESLRRAVATMVSSLVAMSGGRYLELRERFRILEQELDLEAVSVHLAPDLPLVAWPGMAEAARPEVVGAKAASLASLVGQGDWRVPDFFVLTAEAYRRFLVGSGLHRWVNEMLQSSASSEGEALKAACLEIRRAVEEAPVPAEIEAALREGYERLTAAGQTDFGVAVRSSGLLEDTETSFAGQFETVLGVGAEGLVAAYKRVVASKYQPATLAYARSCGVRDEESAMPVLVMAMVQPVASGVAYSRSPDSPETALVTAVPGLGVAAVEGRVTPETFVVSREAPLRVLRHLPGSAARALMCAGGGGLIEETATPGAGPAQDERLAVRVAELALAIERWSRRPQDVEWALDGRGILFVIQSRPLWGIEVEQPSPPVSGVTEGHRLLVSGATRACGGVACGPPVCVRHLDELGTVAAGTVLVVPHLSPRLAAVAARLAAIVAEAGSPTGHMATIARELRVPTLVGARGALQSIEGLPQGSRVTVDGQAGCVYEGEVQALLAAAERDRPVAAARCDPLKRSLKRLVQRVAPLQLRDPRSPDFTVDRCQTLHDIARFVHQKSMAEMFCPDGLSPGEKRAARPLRWQAPMELLVLDLGGGLAKSPEGPIEPKDVVSAPFLALLHGMTDERLRWAGPVGFDLKGFMSVVVRSAADDQRYGEAGFVLCSRDYVQFSSRLAYHFATVDALSGPSMNQNYVRFVFHGGAAVVERRECRAHFLSTVLKYNGFEVVKQADRVEAILAKRPMSVIQESLVMMGQLMVAARHMDMMMDSIPTAEAYAAAFLSGDIGFEFARRE